MKIGFDAKRAFFNSTGLGNYSRTLLSSLGRQFPGNQYFLYSPKLDELGTERWCTLKSECHSDKNFHLKTPKKWLDKKFESAWRTFRWAAEISTEGLDVFHGLSNELPKNIHRTNCKSIVTIHDLIFLREPSQYAAVDRKIYEKKSRYACEVADKIIAISEQTKSDIIEFYGISGQKIEVIYQSCNLAFAKKCSEKKLDSVKEKYNLVDRFVLNVSSFSERKNQLTLVKAFAKLSNPGMQLVLVGNGKKYKTQVENYTKSEGLNDRVHILSYIKSSDLPAIYQLASLFVYPSLFEGFGIPILEALSSGVPVISSEDGCFPEAGGRHSIYINPMNEDAIFEAVSSVLDNSSMAAKMGAHGKEHAAKFSNENSANNLMMLYKSLLQ